MDEKTILALLTHREERGLDAAMEQYGGRLRALAAGIVGTEAAEECVNDALLTAWNAIPPAAPAHLFAYLCRITRNLALDRCRSEAAQKRGGSVLRVSLDELSECIPAAEGSPTDRLRESVLRDAINAFLRGLPKKQRTAFLARYFYAMPLHEVAARCSMREGAVKSMLRRTRERLRKYLEQEELL